jgi:hypothetical protein
VPAIYVAGTVDTMFHFSGFRDAAGNALFLEKRGAGLFGAHG